MHKHPLLDRVVRDVSYRTSLSLYLGLGINLVYAILKLGFGIRYTSFWHGADALYYLVLSAVRFFLARNLTRGMRSIEQEYRQYRLCGRMLFGLNAALVGIVYQVIRREAMYYYPGLVIYAVATYTFFCLVMAIVGMVRYRKRNSPILSAVKAIHLAKALVSIFALQTAMIVTFGGEGSESFHHIMALLTGIGICIFLFCMAVYMINRANRELRKLRDRHELCGSSHQS